MGEIPNYLPEEVKRFLMNFSEIILERCNLKNVDNKKLKMVNRFETDEIVAEMFFDNGKIKNNCYNAIMRVIDDLMITNDLFTKNMAIKMGEYFIFNKDMLLS